MFVWSGPLLTSYFSTRFLDDQWHKRDPLCWLGDHYQAFPMSQLLIPAIWRLSCLLQSGFIAISAFKRTKLRWIWKVQLGIYTTRFFTDRLNLQSRSTLMQSHHSMLPRQTASHQNRQSTHHRHKLQHRALPWLKDLQQYKVCIYFTLSCIPKN